MKVNNIMHLWSRLLGYELWQGFRPTRTMSTSRRINSMSRWRHCNSPALVSLCDQSGSARDARCTSGPFDPGEELEMNNSLISRNTGTLGKRRGFGKKEYNCFQYCSSFGLPSLDSVTLPFSMPGRLFQYVSVVICPPTTTTHCARVSLPNESAPDFRGLLQTQPRPP